RPSGRRADRRLVRLRLAREQADRREVAELPLARAHRRCRVALRELDRIEALGDRAVQILDGDVLADADEALVAAAVEARRVPGGLLELTGRGADDLDAGRQ